MSNYYKVGGSLEYQHPTYVVRQADHDLYAGLRQGEFCYVLNSRQMGKSSLRVQMMKRLRAEGVKCASIDMTRIGSHVTPAEWYGGIVSELIRSFSLSKKIDFSTWWREREFLSPIQRLSEFIEDVLLKEFPEAIIIFIDEVDSTLRVKFRSDFFALIRGCYNYRADNPNYNRLTFCLLGAASPSDLITDKTFSTPFNIGRAVDLAGFRFREAEPLSQGLIEKAGSPWVVLSEVLYWTGGQPFLTQKLCKLIALSEDFIPVGQEQKVVEKLVQSRIIKNWETQDEPEHLRTVRDRILHSPRCNQLLNLWLQILQHRSIPASDQAEHIELRLSGLAVKRDGLLHPCNPIYELVFDRPWANRILTSTTSPLLSDTKRLIKAENSQASGNPVDQGFGAHLPSKPSIDYTQLRGFLARGEWRMADQETASILFQLVGREQIGWLRRTDIKLIPCHDLYTLDSLWTTYSGGQFGFSVQTQIWHRLGGNPEAGFEVYRSFSQQVGWLDRGLWIDYSDMEFNLQAPEGHLPVFWRRKFDNVSEDWCGGCSSLAVRLEQCRLSNSETINLQDLV